MKIYLGADHRGFNLKAVIKTWLSGKKFLVEDMGNDRLDPEDDFPDYAAAVAKKVGAGDGVGVVVCGSGGMALVANKFKNIRWNAGMS